jgi:hypothetical protein
VDIYFNRDGIKIYEWYMNDRPGKKKVTRKAEKYGLTWSGLFNDNTIKYYGNYQWAGLMVWKHLGGDKLPPPVKAPYFITRFKKARGNTYQMNIYAEKTARATHDYKFGEELTYSMLVKPVMPLEDLYRYPPEHWQEKHDELMAKIKKEQEKLARMAEMYRAMDIMNFGYHNFDRLIKLGKAFEIMANFTIKGEAMPVRKIVFITGDNQTKIDREIGEGPAMVWIDPADEGFRIFTVLPDMRLAKFPLAQYRQINFDSLLTSPAKEYSFELVPSEKPVEKKEELYEFLGYEMK